MTSSTAELFSQALRISLIDGAAVAVPTRRQADDYLMQMTVSAEGLRLAFHIIDNEEYDGIGVRLFWAFQTIIYHLPTLTTSQIVTPQQCYTSLSSWLRRALMTGVSVSEMVLNKHAQMMVVGVQEHWPTNQWPGVFSDLFALVQQATAAGSNINAEGTLTYSMRFFAYIEEVVVDQQRINKTEEQRTRDQGIKDRMRVEVIPNLVNLMRAILLTYHHTNADLVALCLNVTQHYIDWADVGYFLNPEWINLIYYLMSNATLRSCCCECMTMLVSKGQPSPELKLETLNTLRLVEAIPPMVDAVVNQELQKTHSSGALYCLTSLEGANHGQDTLDSDADLYLANVCSLVVSTAAEACKTASQLPTAVSIVHAIVPNAVKLFDLPLYVTKECILNWLQTYVKSPLISREEEEQIVAVVLRQSLLPDDESIAFESPVVEQRRQMFNVTRVLNKKNPGLVTMHCGTVLHSVCSQGENVVGLPFQHVEAAVRYVYELGEGLPMANVLKNPENDFSKMIAMLLQSSIVNHPSSVVHSSYFDTLERYHPFFQHYKEFVPILLRHLLQSPAGVCNSNPKVRAKNCLLFTRLVSVLKPQFVEHFHNINTAVLMVLGHEAPPEGTQLPPGAAAMQAGDKCDLYEGLGTLLAVTDLTLCANVVQQIVVHMNTCTQSLGGAQVQIHAPQHNDIGVLLADDISFLSRVAKGIGGIESTRMPDSPPLTAQSAPHQAVAGAGGFPAAMFLPQQAPPQTASSGEGGGGGGGGEVPATVRVFLFVADAVMKTLDTWGNFPLVREKSTLFVHQIINILGTECLPFVQSFVSKMMSGVSIQELTKLSRVVFQTVQKTRAHCVPMMGDILPIFVTQVPTVLGDVGQVDSVLGVVAESVKERCEAYRHFFTMLHGVTHTGCIRCFELPACQACLPALLTMLAAALNTSPKLELVEKSLQIVTRLGSAWLTAESDIENWLLGQYLPAAFLASTTWAVDARLISLLGDFGSLLFMLSSKLGDRGLYSVFAILTGPNLGVPQNEAHNLLSAVKDCPEAQQKQLRNPLKDMVTGVQRRKAGA